MVYNVFLSFTSEDRGLVESFRNQVENAGLPVSFRDYAVRDRFDETWKSHVAKEIERCSSTICLIGEKTYQSEPVNWEVEKSFELQKPVIAVYLTGGRPRLPRALLTRSIKPVPREASGVIQEIRGVLR